MPVYHTITSIFVTIMDENSASLQEKNESNEITKKFIQTQNIIKKKFSKAYANRLENENNLNHVMQPILLETSNETDISLSTAKQVGPMSTKQFVNINSKSFNDPNELCDRLRQILSSLTVYDERYIDEMNAIIMKLRELDLLL